VLHFREAIESALGIAAEAGDRIAYAYSRPLPHWLLNTLFLSLAFLAVVVAATGVVRFWRAMQAGDARQGRRPPGRGLLRSIFATTRRIVMHDNFAACSDPGPRFLPHVAPSFGFLGLLLVGIWAITAKINPLAVGPFVYPFNFWSPWKILANLSALAVIGGCALMTWRRLQNRQQFGANRYPDWALIVTLLLVVLTGLVTEALHYLRLEPHRHAAYFVHLILVFVLLVYLPYSKLAHVIYRTTAMVYSEYSGRNAASPVPVTSLSSVNLQPAESEPQQEPGTRAETSA